VHDEPFPELVIISFPAEYQDISSAAGLSKKSEEEFDTDRVVSPCGATRSFSDESFAFVLILRKGRGVFSRSDDIGRPLRQLPDRIA
jgi:hypothetical protein